MKKLTLFLILILGCIFSVQSQSTTVVIRPDGTTGQDAMIHGLATQVTNNFGNTNELTASAWTYGNPVGVTRSLIAFDLSGIPYGATIVSAYLSLYAWDMFNGTGSGQHSTSSGSNEAYLERVMSSWDESTVTWATQPTTTNHNRVTIPASTSPTQNYPNIDVTDLITDMVAVPNTAHGFLLRLVTEVHYRRLNFCSSEHPDSLKRPKLEITYSGGSTPPQPPDSCRHMTLSEHHMCKGDSVMVYGDYRKASGIYTDTLASILNTDSILVTSVHVHDPAVHFIAHDLCDGDSIWAAGAWQSKTGFYLDTYSSAVGCDSLVYNLVKHTQIYTAVLRNGTTLSSIEPGALYQWVDCNGGFIPIAGATSQSFTPSVNGSYAVMIFKENCVGLSSCILVDNLKVKSITAEDAFRIAPNPTTGKTMLEFGRVIPSATVRLSSLNGQELRVIQARNSSMVEVDLSGFAKGLYTVTVTIDGNSTAQTIVLE